ncbi:MAG: hypothetical protein IRY97_07905, partial [Thermomicrobiaceae bacterium]|nr:hypothetical protein [Thermomicrobiaceae bacterium]
LEAVEEREQARPTLEPPAAEPRAAARVTDLREARRASRPAPAAEPGEYDPANYSWNEFWFWARGLGYRGKQQLEQLLGVDDLLARTPAEARALVEAYRREHGEEA